MFEHEQNTELEHNAQIDSEHNIPQESDAQAELPLYDAAQIPDAAPDELFYDDTTESPYTPRRDPEPSPYRAQNPYYTAAQPPKPRKQKKKAGMTGGRVVALALCCSLIGGIVGGVGVFFGMRGSAAQPAPGTTTTIQQGERENTLIETVNVNTDEELTIAEVYAANVNSTVGITTSITTNYWGFETTQAASGSGFILTADGYVLTNYHVIEGASSVSVTLYDGTAYDAEVIGYDESNDIAVLKVEATDLTPVVLGDSDGMNVGDTVVAIGNPLGELTFSLTSGVISAMSREVTLSAAVTMDLIQTDCAINSGNSGGALFNLYGEVIGITNAKYSSGSMSEASIDNIGFAIPINGIRPIVDQIIEQGYISKPYIGITVTDVSTDAQRYGLPQGAAVQSVGEDSPAAAAGLQPNDIITMANGVEVTGSNNLVSIVQSLEIGDTLTLSVYRQNETLELVVTVGELTQNVLEEPAQNQQTVPQYPQGDYNPFAFGGIG